MGNAFEKIKTIVYDNGASPFFSLRYFLAVISKSYGGAVKLRRAFYNKSVLTSKKLSCPVISIGNITVGGTGKTPMTIWDTRLPLSAVDIKGRRKPSAAL
jgi:tetraacyldisaccharide 4'-kinase